MTRQEQYLDILGKMLATLHIEAKEVRGVGLNTNHDVSNYGMLMECARAQAKAAIEDSLEYETE